MPVECQKFYQLIFLKSIGALSKTIDIIFILYYSDILFCITTLVQKSCHFIRRKYERMMRVLLFKENYLINYLIKQFIELTNQSF